MADIMYTFSLGIKHSANEQINYSTGKQKKN